MARLAKICALTATALLSACASWSEWPHENFKHYYAEQVGKRIDDPSASIARYPEDIVARRVLPNGNTEFELLKAVSQIDDAKCLVFYEVDSKTNVIVAWRYEGNERVCYWAP